MLVDMSGKNVNGNRCLGNQEKATVECVEQNDSLFCSAVHVVLQFEGGFVDDPCDRGGKTNMGITQKFLDRYRHRAGVKARDVAALTPKEAVKLYKAEWDTYGFALLDNADVAILVYDFAVHSGAKLAIAAMQTILNTKGCGLAVDGYIGVLTNRAVNSVDSGWLKTELQRTRALHCDGIVDKDPKQKRFIKGWFNRINTIGKKCGCNTVFRSRHVG